MKDEMLRCKSLLLATNFSGFYSKIEDCIKEIVYVKNIRTNAKKYVNSKSFILDKTVKTIQKYLV
jgi:hypothetical protein